MQVDVEVWFAYSARRKGKRNHDRVREKTALPAAIPVRAARPALREGSGGAWKVTAYATADGFLAPIDGDPAVNAASALLTVPADWRDAQAPVVDELDEVVETFGREAALAEAANRFREAASARGLVLVDGVLCEPCPEPVIQVDLYDRRRGERRTGRGEIVRHAVPDRGRPSGSLYNLVRAAELEARYGSGDFRFFDVMFEVLAPDAFRYDDASFALAREADGLASALADRLKEADVAYFVAYADLRDRLAAWRAGAEFGPGDVAAAYAAADVHDASTAWANWQGANRGDRRKGLDLALEGTRFVAMVPPPTETDAADLEAIAEVPFLR